MNTGSLEFISSDVSSLYNLQVQEHVSDVNLAARLAKSVQADISRNTVLANTILLKYISDPATLSAEDLKGIAQLLKLGIISAIDDHPSAALSYSKAAADCIFQIKKRQAASERVQDKQAASA